jgi:hypothetical protein
VGRVWDITSLVCPCLFSYSKAKQSKVKESILGRGEGKVYVQVSTIAISQKQVNKRKVDQSTHIGFVAKDVNRLKPTSQPA